jgi:AraC family transcriptional regulator, activator of mtrCDE
VVDVSDITELAASRLLAEENLSVSETALRVGYESEPAFSKAFKRHFGRPPLA